MALDRVSSDKIREIKEERKRKTLVRSLVAVVSLFVIAGSVICISRAPQLQINQVIVRGNYIVSSDEVLGAVQIILGQKYAWLFPKTNVFLYPNAYITQTIQEKFPRFDTVSISRVNWGTLIVDVTERKNVYLWCDTLPLVAAAQNTNENCYYVDGHGYIFSRAPTFSGNVYFTFFGTYGWDATQSPIGKRILSDATFKDLIRFKEGLELHGMKAYGFTTYTSGIESFLLAPSFDDSKQKIVFNNTQDLIATYTDLISALDAPDLKAKLAAHFDTLEYLDLRYDNKVYYKFTGSNQSQ